jgi:hypothetical protein
MENREKFYQNKSSDQEWVIIGLIILVGILLIVIGS